MNPNYFAPVLIGIVLYFTMGAIKLLRRHDLFLKRLYDLRRPVWEKLGKPSGWQWSAPNEVPNLFSTWKMNMACLTTENPNWLEDVPELASEFYEIRRGIRRMSFVAIPTITGAFLIFLLVVWSWQKH